MNVIIYGIVEEHHMLSELRRISYGIEAFAHVSETRLDCIVASVHDLSEDRVEIEALIERFNRLEVSPDHLEELVADWQGERAGFT